MHGKLVKLWKTGGRFNCFVTGLEGMGGPVWWKTSHADDCHAYLTTSSHTHNESIPENTSVSACFVLPTLSLTLTICLIALLTLSPLCCTFIQLLNELCYCWVSSEFTRLLSSLKVSVCTSVWFSLISFIHPDNNVVSCWVKPRCTKPTCYLH